MQWLGTKNSSIYLVTALATSIWPRTMRGKKGSSYFFMGQFILLYGEKFKWMWSWELGCAGAILFPKFVISCRKPLKRSLAFASVGGKEGEGSAGVREICDRARCRPFVSKRRLATILFCEFSHYNERQWTWHFCRAEGGSWREGGASIFREAELFNGSDF